jgi:hypothetical protein
MKIGMTLPVMEPDLDRQILHDWVKAIDQGPWDSLAFGERIIFDNPDAAVMLGACAAWTERVEIVTTIFVAQLHNPVMLAKQIATAVCGQARTWSMESTGAWARHQCRRVARNCSRARWGRRPSRWLRAGPTGCAG